MTTEVRTERADDVTGRRRGATAGVALLLLFAGCSSGDNGLSTRRSKASAPLRATEATRHWAVAATAAAPRTESSPWSSTRGTSGCWKEITHLGRDLERDEAVPLAEELLSNLEEALR